MNTFTISASGLSAYYQCPARYQYQRQWKKARFDKALQDGIDTHSMMAGIAVLNPSTASLAFRDRLRQMLEGYDRLSKKSEIEDVIEWPNGVRIKRIMDRAAIHRHDGPVILDYKTGNWPWTEEPNGIYAKAEGSFQSVIYTLLPTSNLVLLPGKLHWPDTIHYLTVPEMGPNKTISYVRQGEDVTNLADAIDGVRSATKFPKHRGYHCKFCPFNKKCFGVERKNDYIKREEAWDPQEEKAGLE